MSSLSIAYPNKLEAPSSSPQMTSDRGGHLDGLPGGVLLPSGNIHHHGLAHSDEDRTLVRPDGAEHLCRMMYTILIADEVPLNTTATAHVLIVPTVLSPGFKHPIPTDEICEPFPREAIETAAYAREVALRLAAPHYTGSPTGGSDGLYHGHHSCLPTLLCPTLKSDPGVPHRAGIRSHPSPNA